MTRIPFGLNNAESTYQRTMEMALQLLQWVRYLIDIVFGKKLDQHVQRVEKVINRIETEGLKLNRWKSHLLQKDVFLHTGQSFPQFSPVLTNLILHTLIRPVGWLKNEYQHVFSIHWLYRRSRTFVVKTLCVDLIAMSDTVYWRLLR